MKLKEYKDERNRKVKLTDEQFDLLPASKQRLLTKWEAPALPEFLTAKKVTDATSNGSNTQNGGSGSNGIGSSQQSTSEGTGKDNPSTGTGIPQKAKGKPGRKAASK